MLKNNPSILYQPGLQKNKSRIFEKVPLFNKNGGNSNSMINSVNNKSNRNLDIYLDELKGYSKRIQNINMIKDKYNR